MIRRTLDFLFAVILLSAASLKAQTLLNTGVGHAADRMSFQNAFAALAILIEVCLAFWLLTGAAALWARRAAIALLTLFVGFAGWSLLKGESDCGCFGALRVHPGWTLGLDAVLLAGFLFSTRTAPAPSQWSWQGLFRAAMLTITIPAAVLSLPLNRHASANFVVLDAKSLIGQRLPLINYIDDPEAREDIARGEKTAVIFSRGCETCRAYLQSLETQQPRLADDNVQLIDIGSDDTPPFDSRFRTLRLREAVEYVSDVPLRLHLDDGIVESVEQQ